MKESEERFRLLFERSADPVLLIEGDKFVDCNEAALKALHCTAKEQVMGLHPSSISPERQPDGSMSSEAARSKLDTTVREKIHRFEWMHQTFDGADLWVDVSLTAIPLQGKEIVHTLWRDITEKKRMEEKLEREMQKFLALAESSPFAMVLVDKDRSYTYTNTKFKELFGYDLHDLPNEDAWYAKAYPDPGSRSRALAKRWDEMDGFMRDPSLKEGKGSTFTVTCKDGRHKVVHIIRVRLPSGDYLKVYQDVTAQKKAEEVLRNREAELALKTANLQDMNAALKVLLNERENDRIELKEKIVRNVEKLVMPYIDELRRCKLDPSHMAYVNMIDANLKNIVSPFLKKLGLRCADLTLRETRIADLVKNGKTTKEISQLLQITPAAVNFHRNNIRKKLNLSNQKINLAVYLASL